MFSNISASPVPPMPGHAVVELDEVLHALGQEALRAARSSELDCARRRRESLRSAFGRDQGDRGVGVERRGPVRIDVLDGGRGVEQEHGRADVPSPMELRERARLPDLGQQAAVALRGGLRAVEELRRLLREPTRLEEAGCLDQAFCPSGGIR
jgi:hypothetical protein